MNIQGKVKSFLMELLLGPIQICVESRKFILKECKNPNFNLCMCGVCMCTVCFLVCVCQKVQV